VDPGWSLEKIEMPDVESDEIYPLVYKGFMQWGEARSRQHIGDLLRAAASYRKDKTVSTDDITLVRQLLKPLWVEQLVMDKKDLEAERILTTDLLYLITELTTYGKITVSQMSRNYKISERTAQRYLDRHQKLLQVVSKNPTTYAATQVMEDLLMEVI
tara:strand:+ start:79 stop:552 length:474 start_codon:yes stop_codon:yes gene_type:complete